MYFQNLSNFVKYEKGKASKESMLEMSYLNHASILGYINWFRVYIMPNEHTITGMYNTLADIVGHAYSWFTSGDPPKYIVKELDKHE